MPKGIRTRIISTLIEEFNKKPMDSFVVSLIGAGSFARAEETIVPVKGSFFVLGDIECLLWVKPGAFNAKTASLCRQISDTVKMRLEIANIFCSLSVVLVKKCFFLGQNLDLFTIETIKSNCILWGKKDLFITVSPKLSIANKQKEAWQLLNNRLMELLTHSPNCVELSSFYAALEYFYACVKMNLAFTTAISLLSDSASFSYGEMLKSLRANIEKIPSLKNLKGGTAFLKELERWSRFKINPEGEPGILEICNAEDEKRMFGLAGEMRSKIDAHYAHVWRAAGSTITKKVKTASIALTALNKAPSGNRIKKWIKFAIFCMTTGDRTGLKLFLKNMFRTTPKTFFYTLVSVFYFLKGNVCPKQEKAELKHALEIIIHGTGFKNILEEKEALINYIKNVYENFFMRERN